MGGIVYIAEPHPWIPAFAGMTELCKGLPRGKIEMGALGLTKSKAVHSTPKSEQFPGRHCCVTRGCAVIIC